MSTGVRVLCSVFSALIIFFLSSSGVAATPYGKVECSKSESCTNTFYVDCPDSCPSGNYDCSWNCPTGGGGTYDNYGCPCGGWVSNDCKKDCPGGVKGDWCGYTTTGADKFMCRQHGCNTCPACDDTKPTNLGLTGTGTRQTLTWTPGTLSDFQKAYVGQNPTSVSNECPSGVGSGTGCVDKSGELTPATATWSNALALPGNRLLNWMVFGHSYQPPNCVKASDPVNSCAFTTVSVSPTGTLYVGQSKTVTSGFSVTDAIYSVDFTSSNPTALSLSKTRVLKPTAPPTGTIPPYAVTVTANAVKATPFITAKVILNVGGTLKNICERSITIPISNPICSASLALSPTSMLVGDTRQATLNVTTVPAGTSIAGVVYSANPATVVNINQNAADPTKATVTALAMGTTTITATATLTTGGTCTGLVTVNVGTSVNPDAWWRVRNGDVWTNGILKSSIPSSTAYFELPGLTGGYPGIPIFSGSLQGAGVPLDKSTISQTFGWHSNTSVVYTKPFDYSYVISQIPSDITPVTINTATPTASDILNAPAASDGYIWLKYDGTILGDLSINNALAIGNKKIILIVGNANLKINAYINGITKGSGFFLAVVDRGINVNASVGSTSTYLEGLYVADNVWKSEPGSLQLRTRGTVVAHEGFTLQRDMGSGNSGSAADYFEYAPDLVALFPPKLSVRRINWKEVAP